MTGSDAAESCAEPIGAEVLVTAAPVPTSLSDLVADRDSFLASSWGARSRTFRCPAALSLLQPAEIWDILECGSLIAPYFGMRRNDGSASIAGITETRIVQTRPMSMYADPAAIREKMAEGGTLALIQPEHWHAPVRKLLAGLRMDLRAEVRSSAFLSLAGESRLAARADTAHNFLLQLHGRAGWIVSEDEADVRYALRPGEILYVPAGHLHREEFRDSESLHLVITVTQPTAWDLAELALTSFLHSRPARDVAGTHHFMSPAEKVAWLRVELADFLRGQDLDALLDAAVQDRQGRGVG